MGWLSYGDVKIIMKDYSEILIYITKYDLWLFYIKYNELLNQNFNVK